MFPELEKLVEGKYEVLAKIAEGGMGSVYKVRHRLLEEIRAIKMLRSPIADRVDFRQRFLIEARTAATLKHSGVAQIYDFSVSESGDAYIVMEFVDGETLATLLQRAGPPSLALGIEICLQALRALDYLHGQGIVLRDVAPDNLMVAQDSGGRPAIKLIDLGIAKNLRDETSITQVGTFMGKVRYAAPEQFENHAPLNAVSDLYSFGVMMYELLTGRYPFEGESFQELVWSHLKGTPLDFELSDPEGRIPSKLRKIVHRAINKIPDERYQSAGDLARQLEQFADPSQPLTEELARALETVRDSARPEEIEPTVVGPTGPLLQVDPPAAQPWPTTPPTRPPTPPQKPPEPPSPPPSAPDVVAGGTVISPHAGLGKQHSEIFPSRVGRFTLHELVAEGRTGKLYKAYDPVRGYLVGLKVIHDPSGVAQQRLLRGAGIWIDLQHPNLLRILHVDLGSDSQPAVVATELIDGMDLVKASMQRRFSLEEKLSIIVQLCEALSYLHTQGVIHREVKPGNILVSPHETRVTLLDSGIARRANPGAGDDLTQVGMVVGDLNYMAPEQALGRFDQRSDIFSVGAVLYELLTGKKPSFHDLDQMRKYIEEEVHPQRLRTIACRALSHDPEARYSRAEELADALRELVPERSAPVDLSRVVATLHGIRTHASWQRAFSEVASRAGLECRLDRWNFGYFSVLRFLLPWARRSRVLWLRQTYHAEFGDQAMSPLSERRPSIVAHSFGTYILGNALIRYPYLRFNKVLLCGSILHPDFPWADLIDRGQVQAVRNEFGTADLWTRLVRWFVPGTGPSGISGFNGHHLRLHQERFAFAHSEYFEKGHMNDKWVPFLRSRLSFITLQDREIETPRASIPWGLLLIQAATLGAVVFAALKFLP